jgi:hypothetical protein
MLTRCLATFICVRDKSDSIRIFLNEEGSRALNQLLDQDDKFSEEFNYLISDMNSHPKHLFYYFKAILIYAFKRKHGLNERSNLLKGESLENFNRTFELFLSLFEMNSLEKEVSRSMISLNLEDTLYKKSDSIKPFNLVNFTALDAFFTKLFDN